MSNATITADSCQGLVASSTIDVLRCVTRVPPGPRPHVVVPEEQLYYWSREWQEAEQEALNELRRGLGVHFDDATEMIRWLLSNGP